MGRCYNWCKKSIQRIDNGISTRNIEMNVEMEAKLLLLQHERGDNGMSSEQDNEHVHQ